MAETEKKEESKPVKKLERKPSKGHRTAQGKWRHERR